jgi:hypothetical protein
VSQHFQYLGRGRYLPVIPGGDPATIAVTRESVVTDAPWYVTATDAFMSGWGPASDMRNVVILPCVDRDEASVVFANTRARTDMRRPHLIGRSELRFKTGILYSMMARTEASRWYQREGGFADEISKRP